MELGSAGPGGPAAALINAWSPVTQWLLFLVSLPPGSPLSFSGFNFPGSMDPSTRLPIFFSHASLPFGCSQFFEKEGGETILFLTESLALTMASNTKPILLAG